MTIAVALLYYRWSVDLPLGFVANGLPVFDCMDWIVWDSVCRCHYSSAYSVGLLSLYPHASGYLVVGNWVAKQSVHRPMLAEAVWQLTDFDNNFD